MLAAKGCDIITLKNILGHKKKEIPTMLPQAKGRKNLFFKLRRHHYIALLLIIIALAIFGRSYRFEFLNYDDGLNVYENSYVKEFKLLHFWEKPHLGMYIPLTYNLWAFQAKLAKKYPAERAEIELSSHLFHTTNIIIHILSILVVFSILRLLIKNDWAAWAGALLFAIHPVQVEPVLWITGLKNVLSGFLSLVAVWQYLSYVALNSVQTTGIRKFKTSRKKNRSTVKQKRLHYIMATIAYVLAVLAMPMAIVVPLVALILGYWMLKRPLRQCAMELIPWAVIALPIIILTILSQPDVTLEFVAPFWQRPLVAGDALIFYLYKLIMPISLGPDYGRTPKFVLEHGWAYLTGLIPYLVAVVLIWKYRKPRLLAPAGIFIASVLPVLGLVPFRFQEVSTVADRYLYIAMLGPALALAWFLSSQKSRQVRIICVLILGMFGLRSAQQTQYWKSSNTLFKHALVVNSNSALANINLGVELRKQGKLEEAIIHYKETLRIKPNYTIAHNNLGIVLEMQGKLEEAIVYYNEAIRLTPDYAEAQNNLGIALHKQGKLEEAITHFNEALKLKPDFASAHFNLGIALQKQGNLEEAITHYNKAIRLRPNHVQAHNNLGSVLEKKGKFDEAAVHLKKALKLDPNFAEAHFNLGSVLQKQGKLEEAIACYTKAFRLKPDYTDARNKLGFLMEKQGKLEEATDLFEEVLQLKPDSAEAHFNLGSILQKQGKLEEAIIHYKEAVRLKPDSVGAHNSLGTILISVGKFEEATTHFNEALKLKPDSAEAHFNLGFILVKQGRLEEAVAHLTEVLKILPDFAEAHNNLGTIFHRLGRLDEAITHYNEALRINPGFKQARRNLDRALQEKKKK